jgi:hypothetical protein
MAIWQEMFINTSYRLTKLLSSLNYRGTIPCYDSNLNIVEDNIKDIEVIFGENFGPTISLKELYLENGFYLVCTCDQKVMTTNKGWVEVQNLCNEDTVVCGDKLNSNFQKLCDFPHTVHKVIKVYTQNYDNAFISNIMCKTNE